jgi:hypothetical protein
MLLNVKNVKDMGTPKIIAISNRDATEKKDRVMSDVSSVVEINVRITREVRSTSTYKRKHTHLSVRNNTLLLNKSNKPYTLNQE